MNAGAAVVTMTHAPGSACDTDEWISIVYDWAPGVKEAEKPQGIVLRILNELMKIQEPGYVLYDKIAEGFDKIDEIIAAAVKDQQNAAWLFAEKYSEEPNLYIMHPEPPILRHMALRSAHFRKCSGWTAVI